MENGISFKEQRIRNITHIYYSKPEIQKAIFEFSKHREISPQYFAGFGKRPDAFQYPSDVFGLVKKGATSFHCSEELWKEPLRIETGMTEEQANDLRIGWDLLIDIDCKWMDYSKKAAIAIVNVLKDHGIKNVGIKFSGSKGFHVIVPWKAFPKEIFGEGTKNMFPNLPRKVIAYLRAESEKYMKKSLPEDFYKQFKDVEIKKGIKCKQCNEIADSYELLEVYCPLCRRGERKKLIVGSVKDKYICPECGRYMQIKPSINFAECKKCKLNSEKHPENFSSSVEIDVFELMGLDIVLVSPRHLFRMPYSLHEKTSLVSVILKPEEIESFDLKDANYMKVNLDKTRNFYPDAQEGEAKELVIRALDWYKDNQIHQGEVEEKVTGKYADYKPIKLDSIKDENFPPCLQRILKGIVDGKKRAVFVLINLFRSIGMEKEELEKRIDEWNEKNKPSLKKGYIKSQLLWSYRRKPRLPPNCKEFYQGIGVCLPDNFCGRIKNPTSYVIKKTFGGGKNRKKVEKKASIKSQ